MAQSGIFGTVSRILDRIDDGQVEWRNRATDDAQEMLNKQINCAENRKDDLIRMLHFNILFIGSAIAFFSFISQPEAFSISDFWNVYTVTFVLLWFGSTLIALWGYHESGLNVKFSNEGLEHITSAAYSDSERAKIRLELYKAVIESNQGTGRKCGLFTMWSLTLSVYSIVVLVVGVLNTTTELVSLSVLLPILMVLTALAVPVIQSTIDYFQEDEPDVEVGELL